MNPKPVVVGTYEVREPEVWEETFETASWYRMIKVPPGVYPVHAYPCHAEGRLGSVLYVVAAGVCTSSYFSARLLGHVSHKTDEDVGRTYRVRKCLRPYDLARPLFSGELVLDHPRVELYAWTVDHPTSGSREAYTAHLMGAAWLRACACCDRDEHVADRWWKRDPWGDLLCPECAVDAPAAREKILARRKAAWRARRAAEFEAEPAGALFSRCFAGGASATFEKGEDGLWHGGAAPMTSAELAAGD